MSKINVNFGFFDYQYISSNIGDDIQTLAMIGMLKKMKEIHSLKFPLNFSEYDCVINPDARYILNMIPINRDNSSKTSDIPNIICVMNGWFMHKIDTPMGRSKFTGQSKIKLFKNNLDWPPPSNIKPIFISFHINNKYMLEDCYIPYYKLYEPIGCRDRSTAQYLENKGVNSYFSGCLTLTLDNINKSQKGNDEYNVDILSTGKSKYITHQKLTYSSMNYVKRIPIAQKLLDGYASAKSVTTNRVHVMLPCLAYGTKVNFIIKKQNDPRLLGLLELIENKDLLENTIEGIEQDFKVKVLATIQKYYTI
jgi:hypothetical protein